MNILKNLDFVYNTIFLNVLYNLRYELQNIGDDDFSLDGDTVIVKASHIYKTLADVEEAGISPVFVIAQHQNKPIGLDYRIYPADMAKVGPKSRAVELSYNDIIS